MEWITIASEEQGLSLPVSKLALLFHLLMQSLRCVILAMVCVCVGWLV